MPTLQPKKSLYVVVALSFILLFAFLVVSLIHGTRTMNNLQHPRHVGCNCTTATSTQPPAAHPVAGGTHQAGAGTTRTAQIINDPSTTPRFPASPTTPRSTTTTSGSVTHHQSTQPPPSRDLGTTSSDTTSHNEDITGSSTSDPSVENIFTQNSQNKNSGIKFQNIQQEDESSSTTAEGAFSNPSATRQTDGPHSVTDGSSHVPERSTEGPHHSSTVEYSTTVKSADEQHVNIVQQDDYTYDSDEVDGEVVNAGEIFSSDIGSGGTPLSHFPSLPPYSL